jgi:hypothetical protein
MEVIGPASWVLLHRALQRSGNDNGPCRRCLAKVQRRRRCKDRADVNPDYKKIFNTLIS